MEFSFRSRMYAVRILLVVASISHVVSFRWGFCPKSNRDRSVPGECCNNTGFFPVPDSYNIMHNEDRGIFDRKSKL